MIESSALSAPGEIPELSVLSFFCFITVGDEVFIRLLSFASPEPKGSLGIIISAHPEEDNAEILVNNAVCPQIQQVFEIMVEK